MDRRFNQSYRELKSVHFPSFTSCSRNVGIASVFLNEPTSARALLVFNTSWAKDISQHSWVPDEVEALILPGTCFTQVGVADIGSGLQWFDFKDYSSQALLLGGLYPKFVLQPPLNHTSILEMQIEKQKDLTKACFCHLQLYDLSISYMVKTVKQQNVWHKWKELNLFNNNIESDSAIHIGAFLAMRDIPTVNLGKNRLGSKGIKK